MQSDKPVTTSHLDDKLVADIQQPIEIDTDHGTVRLVCSQDGIEIDAKGTKIEVKP